MIFPAMPVNEKERLHSLYMMDLLDKKKMTNASTA